jgi:NhaP-type Na+/H+ or K+/H+ antiporter
MNVSSGNEISPETAKLFLTRAVGGFVSGGVKNILHRLFLRQTNIFTIKYSTTRRRISLATAFSVIAQFTKQKIFHLGKHFADE